MRDPEVIYEDNDIVVINKPAGLSVHPDDFSPGPFLTDWLLANYPNIKEVGDPSRPGLVHRLDKDTSGVMVIAKTPASYEFLKQQFKERKVQKFYLAILAGTFKAGVGSEGVIDLPIGRSLKDPRVRVASKKAYGELREAVTKYKVLAEHENYALVEAELITGRTHQLRAHFKALQHPIIGDNLYGTGDIQLAGLTRQALHSYRLKLTLPKGEEKEFTAQPPADMEAALALFNFKC